jgi:hypothetical protein
MNQDQRAITGEEAYQYLADLFSAVVPFERALWTKNNPLRQKIPQLMQQHSHAVDAVLIAMSKAADEAEMATLIARLPDEVFYVFAARWVNRCAMLLQLLDQVAFVLPAEPPVRLHSTLLLSFVSER